MKHLFMDTNILLSFFHFSNDDLDELRKLAVLVGKGELHLILPDQVISEFRRNRAGKIADALNRLRKQDLSLQFPQLSRGYEEYERIREAQSEYSRLHAELIKRIKADVESLELKADSVVTELFQLADILATTEDIVTKARLRIQLGNPPGKKGSLGDAVNWEILLQKGPKKCEVFFITEDGDYSSPLNDDLLDPFLLSEWKDTKSGSIILYKRLSQFFKAHYPDIELGTELEKGELIRALSASGAFARTHEIIAKLSKFAVFSDAQVALIAEAVANNDQVYWIINDHDVRSFVTSLISRRTYAVDDEVLVLLNERFGELVFDLIPF